jgi:DNA-binding transcriptional LysR family regulator
MQLRWLEYFAALAQERHFARAAEVCSITQPTLSAGIAALEAHLGKRLVIRDRRFIGLTPEGLEVLPWARQVMADFRSLSQAAQNPGEPLRGELRLGAIPASMPATGYIAKALCTAHPRLTLIVRSLTSREIERGLAAFELDAGLTYLDHEPPHHVLSKSLYAEHAMFVARAEAGFERQSSMLWEEVLAEPLCLLHQGMQNRRILDSHLAARGHVLRPRATADSYVALLAMVRAGGFSTIIPNTYTPMASDGPWGLVLPFADPLPESRIGLIVPERSPQSPLIVALLNLVETLRLPAPFVLV